MSPNRTLYGIVVVFVALLLVTSGIALTYYTQYQKEVTSNSNYIGELDSALASYKSLAGSYNSSLEDYQKTLTLLTSAVANLNTTTPVYRNASMALSSLWASYQQLERISGRKALTYEVRMLVDYGNGTRRWHNDTSIQPGWNGYVVTLVLLDGRIDATWYPPGYFGAGRPGEHFVTGLGGVSNNQKDYWFLLTYNRTASWQVAQVGADEIPIFNGTVFGWVYCPENASYGPACPLP